MPLIIGTAGHIDHGKTSLVKALTGQDTDRLKEEKERGISIELGFAHLDLPDGSRVGLVDVPGHERFIRTMLAGAHGMDLVLFTVAADDGVMPQTEEHLDILHLLGVERAIFVITKADLVSPERLRDVDEEIRILIDGTLLEGAPIVPYSFVTGVGLESLRTLIVRTVGEQQARRARGYFRLPVDRVFALQGHGLIVTGTALSGDVHVGDHLRTLPGGQMVRVRSVHVHDEPVETASYGQRVALNLIGQDREAISRGDVVCHEKLTLTSTRFDARLEVRPSARNGVKSHQRVRVHAGTSERLGKVIVLDSEPRIQPKRAGFCQIVVTEPLAVLRGDRFVIRDETAQRTLGGGVVLHPWARVHKAKDADLRPRLNDLQQGDLAAVVAAFIAESDDFAVSLATLYEFLNIRQEDVAARLQVASGVRALRVDDDVFYTTESRHQALRAEVQEALTAWHVAHPLAPGRDMEELRVTLSFVMAPRLFRLLVDELEAEKSVARDGSFLRLPSHKSRLGADEQRISERVRALLSAEPLSPPDLKQLESEIGVPRPKLVDVLGLMEREGTVARITPDLYFLAEAVAAMIARLRTHLISAPDLTPAVFRDLFGTSRKYTIPLLEHLDRQGVTVRTGDVRRLKKPKQEAGA